MKKYLIRKSELTDKAIKKIASQLPAGEVIGAIFSFSPRSVYDTDVTLSGEVVFTGYGMKPQIFVNRGLTKKYIGELKRAGWRNGYMPDGLLSRFKSRPDRNAFIDLVAEVNVFDLEVREQINKNIQGLTTPETPVVDM